MHIYEVSIVDATRKLWSKVSVKASSHDAAQIAVGNQLDDDGSIVFGSERK